MRSTDVIYEADEPVGQDRARALALNEVIREPVSTYLDDQQSTRRTSALVAVAGVVLGIVVIAAGAGTTLGAALLLGGVALGGGGFFYASSQSPDITVTGVEKGYWTGHTIPDEEGVVVYDATASIEPTSFDLERLANEEAVTAARERLDSLGEFPVVMSQEDPVEEEFTGALRELQAEIEDAERRAVEAPVIPSESTAAEAVEFFAAEGEADVVPVEVEVEASAAREDVEALAELERMSAADEGKAELESISDRSRQVVGDLSNAQETAIELLNDHIGTAADAFGLVSYNFYCPDCQLDDIDSTVEFADAGAGEWYCETCRSTHEMDEGIPRHRIKDDIVNPVWDQLWIEKDDQRREIYESIEDQKAELEEREFEQRREEIRSTTDRIRDLRSRIRDLQTEAKAAEGTVGEIGDLMVEYDRINRERKEAFQRDVEEAFAEIDEETDRILEETRNEEQERIEQAQKAAREKAKLIREEERRREVEKFMAAQERSDQRAQGQALQQADLHGEAMEREKQQHRENWMLETRGGTSASGLINEAKLKKDRIIGASAQNGGES